MFKKTLTLIAALALVGTAFGQTAGVRQKDTSSQQQAQHEKGRLTRIAGIQKEVLSKLGLTKKQNEQIEALNKARAEEMKKRAAEHKKSGGTQDKEKSREAMKKSQADYNAKLKAILGTEKYVKYENGVKEKIKELKSKKASAGGGK